MADVPIPISDISDPDQIRVKLLASGKDVHAPLGALRPALALIPYVESVAALQALDTAEDIVVYLNVAGRQGIYDWTAGNFSSQITAADPRYIASSADPTGAAGAWILSGSVETGQFYQPSGAMVHYLADRVMIGSAVAHRASSTHSQPDWLTTFQLSVGRTFGSIQITQAGILNNSSTGSYGALTLGAQSLYFPGAGTATALSSIAVNNNTTQSGTAFAGYNESYRMSGTSAGAYGYELDTINYASSIVINPFSQNAAQTIGLQLAAGAGLSATGQFASTAAINIRNNNSNYNSGIIFGSNSIAGTDGTDGNTGEAIAMATGHAITYYYGNNTKSWTLKANIGVNGDYVFSTAGTGNVVLPRVTTDQVKFPATQVPSSDANTLDDYEEGTWTPTVTASSGTFTTVSAAGSYTKVGRLVAIRMSIVITTVGTAAGTTIATLPFTANATGNWLLLGRENNSTGKSLQGLINGGGTTASILNYDNTSTIGAGFNLLISGVYWV